MSFDDNYVDSIAGRNSKHKTTKSPLAITETQEKFQDHRAVNKYRVIGDCRDTSTGGFSGSVNSVNDYSFLTPNPTSNLYETEVRTSIFTNHPQRFVKAQYEQIFAKRDPMFLVKVGR